jgi:signal transduction histidine kinase/CheY-like chemotaxis protein
MSAHTERLGEAEEMLRAIRYGEIDALVVEGSGGSKVYTLHSTDEPYRHLVEQMQEGAVVLTRRGDVLYTNARFAALVGEPIESVIGSHFDRFVDADDRQNFEDLLSVGSGRCGVSLIGPGAGDFEVSLSLTAAAATSEGRLNLIVTDLRELLEATRSRERAERLNRTKDDFLAMLAHEVRNPLGAINAALGVLDSGRATDDVALRARGVIARQVGHISRMLSDLLDVERVVSGKIRLHREPLDLAKAVQRAVESVAGNPRFNRDIDLRTVPVWISADSLRIEQVLTNILTNAIKYTARGGQIRVTLDADGRDAVLVVEDTGAGISAELLPFIFDLYVQSDRTLDRAQDGLGIGLTLVRRLVEAHDGTVDASSDGEGLGSRFTVRLRAIPSAETSPTAPFLERRAKPRRVLLIEDSDEAREMLRITLELAGHVVHDAPDGERGLKLLDVVRPDVGIIDINLPVMDGYEVARRIREEPQGRDMLLLAMTGYDAPDAARHARKHGFDYHLVKPVDPDLLARMIGAGDDGAR